MMTCYRGAWEAPKQNSYRTDLAKLVAELLNLDLKGSLAVLSLANGRSNRTYKKNALELIFTTSRNNQTDGRLGASCHNDTASLAGSNICTLS